jgi:phosphate/sulfate permease
MDLVCHRHMGVLIRSPRAALAVGERGRRSLTATPPGFAKWPGSYHNPGASVNGWVIVSKVLLPAIVAPLVAGIAAAWATRLAYRITRRTPSMHTGTGFKYGQAFTSSMVALAHGTSDGQKTMGMITLVLIAANRHGGRDVGDHYFCSRDRLRHLTARASWVKDLH